MEKLTKLERHTAIRALKRDANEGKNALMRLERRLREFSAREADSLGRIIGRLEAWQNK